MADTLPRTAATSLTERGPGLKLNGPRSCANCGESKTYIDKNNWSHWYRHENATYWCAKCHVREVISKARIRFNGKQVHVIGEPRTGICGVCNRSVMENEIKVTNLHHLKYDIKNPLAYTIELCVRDHARIHAGKLEVMA